MFRSLFLTGLLCFLTGILFSQTEQDPSRYFIENDWTEFKKGLKNPAAVQKLYILDYDTLPVYELRKFTSLRGLIIHDTPLDDGDLAFIASVKTLRVLELYGNSLHDIAPLGNMPWLEELAINHNFLTRVEPLGKLVNLTYLSLYNNDIVDIAPLANLKELKFLDLALNQITTVQPLAGLTELEGFSVFQCEKLTDVSIIKDFNNLTYLNVSLTPLKNFSLQDVSDMFNMANLRIQGVVRNDLELNYIKHLTKMEQLTMGQNDGITCIDSLKYMVKLTYLDIHSCNVKDINVVKNFPWLVKLVFYRNHITNIQPMVDLPILSAIYVYENPIQDMSLLLKMKHLQHIHAHQADIPEDLEKKLKLKFPGININYL